MSLTLTIEPGDHLAKIAEEYGFHDWHTIWDCPENAQLKQMRDPNLLKPGDKLYVPDKQRKNVSAATGATHHYTLRGKTTRLCLGLRDVLGQPLHSTPVTVIVGDKTMQMTTDDKGVLKVPIEPSDVDAVIVAGAYQFALKIGHLDPVDAQSGLVARLRNLGYLDDLTGDVDADGQPTAEALAFAVELFQNDHKLPVDGSNLDSVRDKLKEIHGC